MGPDMLLVLVVLLLPGLPFLHCFKPLVSDSTTHLLITQRAMLRKTAEVCRDIALSAGKDFTLTIDDSLSAGDVARACSAGTPSSLLSTLNLQSSIATVYLSNAKVDTSFLFSAVHHFDDETFQEGQDLILAGMFSVYDSVVLENFVSGRMTLGEILHTLQDFYSHSNWVELGNNIPYSPLINSEEPIENLADRNTPTCRNCRGGDCTDNILPDVLDKGLLTSGYFSLTSSAKPPGKCSHGGFADLTSRSDPVGGINKDTDSSSHGSLHPKAAELAVLASMELLEIFRLALGDRSFLQFMGLSQSSALCFVIDTTGSMSDDIAEAKRVSFDIIDRKQGTDEEPSVYILVPFNDPDFGPLTRTTDAKVFKERINSLVPNGGGDAPEMSMSGLQLALTGAPPSSEIFVFTDASAKDAELRSTVLALIESTKSVVNFMITDITRRVVRSPQRSRRSASSLQLYYDLAQASGGVSIQVSKSSLSQATAIIEDSSSGTVVTVLQAVRNPGRAEEFSFTIDSSLINVTVYITGFSPLTFNLTSPSGVSQTSSQPSGPLASFSTTGNMRRLRIHSGSQAGLWKLWVDSSNSYSVKVTGQSSVNFLFYVVEAHGASGDFSLKEGRPLSGGNMSLLLIVTGSDTVKVTEVKLVDGSGQTEVNGTLQSLNSGVFLVTFADIPSGEFTVHLRGEESSSTTRSMPRVFQRQASTHIKTSGISLTAQADVSSVQPGGSVSVQFIVATNSSGTASQTLTVRSTNDRDYSLSSPSSVIVAGGRSENATVTMMVPAGATSGTDVTLTIEVQNAAGMDINYAVLRFSVAAKATDLTRPVCNVVSMSNCSSSLTSCAFTHWEFVANFTDGVNGTGIRTVSVRKGNGTLNTSTEVGAGGENVTVATYIASCCSDGVELAAVDQAGNVRTCGGQIRETSPASTASTYTSPSPTSVTNNTSPTSVTNNTIPTSVTSYTSPTSVTNNTSPTSAPTVTSAPLSTAGHNLSTSLWLWISVLGFFLWEMK